MPMIARVDTIGMAEYGDLLQWDPLNAASRRRAAIASRGRAGQTPDASGALVPGSWEEYPFAATRGLARQGSHVDRVPLFENWIQGGFIRAADMAQGFVAGDRILCVIM